MMRRLSFLQVVLLVVLAVVLAASATSARAEAPAVTCDPAQIHADSYALTTEGQALNLTRPRTRWWDAFDATLAPYQDALWDLNEAALALAERALAIDGRNALAHAQLARQLVVTGRDGDRARQEIATLFAAGHPIVWSSTLYDVDAHDYFLLAFDAVGIRVFRFGEAAGGVRRHFGVPQFPGPEAEGLWRALGGCVEGLRAEASIAWRDVDEIKAGHYVLYFKFRTPVRVTGDRGKTKTLRELKVALHGEMGTVDYFVSTDSRTGKPAVRGIGIGPTTYQDRIRRTLAAVVDPGGRIRLPKTSRGAGW